MPVSLKDRLRNFGESRRGNVAMIFALGSPVILMGIAVAVDFSNASIVHSKLNAAADAAALAALTPAMMQQSNDTARAAANAMFDAQANALGSVITSVVSRDAAITNPNGVTNRQADFTYTVQINSLLGGILGQSAVNPLTVHGESVAQATVPPNINFYLLLDNSPSMALPSTAAGITQMQNLTTMQGACAFACHQSSTNNGDTAGNPCADGTLPTLSNGAYCDTSKGHYQIDDFALARLNGITLRLDELSNGVTTLMQTAQSYQNSGIYATPPVYQFAAYAMDSSWSIGITNTRLMALTTNYASGWSSTQSSFGVMEMYSNNNVCGNAACSTSGGTGDVATNFDNALGDIANTMPTPGNGTNQPGDKPQEVLFFVTDGVEDETTGSCTQPMSGSRCQAPIDPALCAPIKAKGIKIAILYTQYLAVPSNSWYQSWIAPFQSSIGTNLQSCASPGLYTQVTFGDNIGAALKNLFNLATQQAALSQ
jgi:Flp pilus assembly protein TadG